ncbi:hypothetical protein VST63_18240 [Mycolicibacterium sp. 050232]|uniref:hypothetical protein n=1 Tax=Mycolicibacterium sp. 050232 TaxID=3113982 RepID=UPI002E2A9426|nr:hypothetical protein [Mycolicibacterium sp. 050232]MED5814305.1 hypothetical protein [Mycolicibacterium sp. 050232]
MATIDDLIELVPPPTEPPVFDLTACEQALGVPLPDDYKLLITVYGVGQFNDDLMLLVPPHPEVDIERTITHMGVQVRQILSELRPTVPETATWLLPDSSEQTVDVGLDDPPAVLGWGVNTGGMHGFWRITGDDPNSWPAVYSDFGGAWDCDPRGLLEFLYAKLTGQYPDSRTGNFDPTDPYFSSFF